MNYLQEPKQSEIHIRFYRRNVRSRLVADRCKRISTSIGTTNNCIHLLIPQLRWHRFPPTLPRNQHIPFFATTSAPLEPDSATMNMEAGRSSETSELLHTTRRETQNIKFLFILKEQIIFSVSYINTEIRILIQNEFKENKGSRRAQEYSSILSYRLPLCGRV